MLALLLACSAPPGTSPGPGGAEDTAVAQDTAARDTAGSGDSAGEPLPPLPVLDNVLLNPSFEEGEGALPEHWTAFGFGSWTWAAGEAAEGTRFLRAGAGPYAGIFQRAPAEEGQLWAVRARARGSGSATLKVELQDAAEEQLVERTVTVLLGEDWTPAAVAALAPAGSSLVTATLVADGSGTAELDQVELVAGVFDEAEPLVVGDEIAATYPGLGSQLWAAESWGPAEDLSALGAVLAALDVRFVRLETLYEAPSDAALQALGTLSEALGARWWVTAWAAPHEHVGADGMLADVPGFAAWWVGEAERLVDLDLPLAGLELMNEPDSGGAWSTGITPGDYAALVQQVRAGLDSAGLAEVELVGPGASAMTWGGAEALVSGLDAESAAALGAWSTHAWDEGTTCTGPACLEASLAALRSWTDPLDAGKPLLITEVASKDYAMTDPACASPDATASASCSWSQAYGVRVVANLLALLQAGTTPFLWQAVDTPGELAKGKSWGLVQADGSPKPGFYDLALVTGALEPGATVLDLPDQAGRLLRVGAFDQGDERVIAITSELPVAVVLPVQVEGDPIEARAVRAEGEGVVEEAVDVLTGEGELRVRVPALSVVVLRVG